MGPVIARGNMEKVLVLLGTYNGAAFLPEQLQSIQQQSFQDWQLLVRDDGSEDDSQNILEAFAREDNRIEILQDRKGRLGVAGNFGELMLAALDSKAEVVCFADQDDVWLPFKMAAQLTLLQESHTTYGSDTPILVYSDLHVVNHDLKTLYGSLMGYQGIRHQADSPLNYLIAQNFVTGCASTINRALLEIAVPMPTDALMHDWWIALCAAVWGRIEYLDRPTLLYRQHSRNQVGAKRIKNMLNPFNRQLFAYWRRGRCNFRDTFRQAAALDERIHARDDQSAPGTAELVAAYAGLLRASRLERLATISRFGIQRQGWPRQWLFWNSLLLEPRIPH